MRLVSWIGNNDLKAADLPAGDPGAIAATLANTAFSEIHLLYSYPQERVSAYLSWLGQQTSSPLDSRFARLHSPIDFHDIYHAANTLLAELMQASDEPVAVLLSSGTPAMQAVWILLGKTGYPVTFYQSTLEQGVQQVEIPFEISAEFVPRQNDQLIRLAAAPVESDAAFDDIVTQNPHMLLLKQQASVLAKRNVPVLIYGETGTGKELFATAIHNASQRHNSPFVVINCGAIPPELMDSVLFGHEKGHLRGRHIITTVSSGRLTAVLCFSTNLGSSRLRRKYVCCGCSNRVKSHR